MLIKANPKLGEWLVLRTILTDKKAYEQHLREIHDPDGNTLEEALIREICDELPDYFWLTELTLPDLYTANKRKLGDVLFKKDELKFLGCA